MPLTTQQIATLVGGELAGSGALTVDSIERIEAARPNQITLISDEKYARKWPESRAAAAIALSTLTLETNDGRALIRVANVDLAVAKLLEAFAPPAVGPAPGIHPSAAVDPTASVASSARVGPHCTIGPRVKIGEHAVLHANVTVLDDSSIGDSTVLWPGVVVRERCVVGSHCILHPCVVIGADGFGFRPAPEGRGIVKIPQIGNVVIGHHVEIGAGTCVDRAKFGSTEIGDMTKIDNLCQIAHNVRLGRGVVMAAQCAVAGSSVVEDGVVMGGKVGLRDHITVGKGARLAAYAAVMGDVPAGATWGGYPAKDAKMALREIAALGRLPDLLKKMKERKE